MAEQPQAPPGAASTPRAASWDAEQMLDVYVLDYLRKRQLLQTAACFQNEAKLAGGQLALDTPSGFLFEWWCVFWDVFIARGRQAP